MKSYTVFTILALMTFIQLSFTQPDTLWTRTYGWGTGNCVIETSDSGYAIIASTERLILPTTSDLKLIKTNIMGDTIWTKTFGDTNFGDFGYSIRQTSDGGFIIVGSTATYGAGEQDVWLLKTNEYGDTLWTKTFGGNSDDIGKCIQITANGGYIIVGVTNCNLYSLVGDLWLIKTDSSGNTEWTKTFGNTQDERGNFVRQTNDLGYIVVGGKAGDLYLVKTNSNGDTSWTNTFGLPEDDYGESVIETNDGYVIAHSGCRDGAYVSKTNLSGDSIWTKCLTVGGLLSSAYSPSLITINNGSFLLGTYGYSWPPGGGRMYYFIGHMIMTDTNGNVLWDKGLCEGPSWGIASPSCINSVIQTYDSCYVATGAAIGELFLAKVAPHVTGLQKIDNIITQTFSIFQNYPNPFNPTTTIGFDLPKSGQVTLKIYNILGEEIVTLVSERLSAGSYSHEWDASNLSSGVYMYRLQAGNYVETRKMVLVR